jgi:NadR type nicotinamide-nucleotide adenylyltransferase
MDAAPLPLVKKVAIIGPECTGKSDLSEYLAGHFNSSWVPEYARGYIDNLVRPYEMHDLLTISHGQLRLEDSYTRTANKVLFCDTNLYVIKIWSEFKFGECPPEILETIAKRKYDLYLLTYVDIPWQEDPQREHPDKREELYQLYLKEMNAQAVPFVEIRGERELRRKTAVDAVTNLVNNVST